MRRLHAEVSFFVRYLGAHFCALFFCRMFYKRDENDMNGRSVFENDMSRCSVFGGGGKTRWRGLFGF